MTDEKEKKPPIPPWAWIFAIACVMIPVLTLGGALPGAIGGGGAFGCISIARDPTKELGLRVVLCSGVVVLCWGLFLVFLGGVAVLFG